MLISDKEVDEPLLQVTRRSHTWNVVLFVSETMEC